MTASNSNLTPHKTRMILAALASLLLSGCYVEYSEYDHYHSSSVEDYRTDFLARTALMPYALGATSMDMLANPDAYLTPAGRSAARSHWPVETTTTYLFDSGPCDFGGSTSVEATGETATYDDAMTRVELSLTARATECRTSSWLGRTTANSRLDYQVDGWYDDAFDEIASLDASLAGYLRLNASGRAVKLSGLDVRIQERTRTDFDIRANAGLWLDDGWTGRSARLSTLERVHWYQDDDRPHAGKVRIEDGWDWVELSFSASGVSRRDSDGYRDFIGWWELD